MPDDEKKQEQEQGGQEKKAGGKGPNRMLVVGGIIGGIIALEIVVMGVLISVTRPKSQAQREEEKSAQEQETARLQQTEFGGVIPDQPIVAIVNIAGTDGDRYLKVGIQFEVAPSNKELPDEVARRIPKFKTIFIDYLSQMTLTELNEPDAKDRIRKEFLRQVNKTLPKKKVGSINDVLLTDFIIQ